MNWRGQMLPVLASGLPSKDTARQLPVEEQGQLARLPQPSLEQIARFSPLAHIVRGEVRSPTYLVHGTEDDLIPWQQSQRTYEALVAAGVDAGISVLEGQPHLFDLFSDGDGKKWERIVEAFDFVFQHLGVALEK
jgi:dipeptidyl aminopeptidase/acylaminoacyl peptidase